MKSKRGIYYNLKESDYTKNIGDFKFVFSSLFYLTLFSTNLESYIIYEENRINKKLQTDLDLVNLILINHYKKIEKRGFLVYYKNKELTDYKFVVQLETR